MEETGIINMADLIEMNEKEIENINKKQKALRIKDEAVYKKLRKDEHNEKLLYKRTVICEELLELSSLELQLLKDLIEFRKQI